MENIQSAQLVLPCSPFDETISFFRDQLQFRIDQIFPADDPSVVVISGYGINIRLEKNLKKLNQSTPTIRLLINDPSNSPMNETSQLIAPNGTIIQFVKLNEQVSLPPLKQSLTITKMTKDTQWIKGRAEMMYRDLIPDRQGGRFIASHIQIIEGGPVDDNVHYHSIHFQIIYIYKGWVRLVYQDQGQPFLLHQGDCVLQPPTIRHRVLESSPGLEVIEVACPAIHDTNIEYDLDLPTKDSIPHRQYHGQTFIKYISSLDKNQWKPWRIQGFEYKNTEIDFATNNLSGVKIIRTNQNFKQQFYQHKAEFVFIFVLNGQISLEISGETSQILTDGDSVVLPENITYTFNNCSDDLQFLEVTLPANFPTIIQ